MVGNSTGKIPSSTPLFAGCPSQHVNEYLLGIPKLPLAYVATNSRSKQFSQGSIRRERRVGHTLVVFETFDGVFDGFDGLTNPFLNDISGQLRVLA